MAAMDEKMPLLGRTAGTASTIRTFANAITSMIGTGVLGLPFAYKTSGWAVASASILISAALTYYCMILLVRCKQTLISQGMDHISTYSDIGEYLIPRFGRHFVEVALLVGQIGCCVAYLIFISHNLASIIPNVSYAYVVLMLVPFQIFLSWIHSLATLAPFSICANVCNMLAMAIVLKNDIGKYQGFSHVHSYAAGKDFWFALGVCTYCYGGIPMTLSLKASMKRPEKFWKILLLAFVFITLVYVLFGFLSYLAFGDDTSDIITMNLPHHWSTALVKLGLCISLFFTFPMMLYPVHEIVENRILMMKWFQELPPHNLCILLSNTLRGVVVLLVALLATSVPGFSVFISLVGSTVYALLCFVFPAFFHLQIHIDKISMTRKVGDILLIFLGIIFCVYGICRALSF